jgi:hypothetical protein
MSKLYKISLLNKKKKNFSKLLYLLFYIFLQKKAKKTKVKINKKDFFFYN